MNNRNWRKYAFEFISIFVAVISAFALNNWNDHRRDKKAETKILSEISNGLYKDIEDVKLNMAGHKQGLAACVYWRKILFNEQVDQDSLQTYYLGLTRDFISIQNVSGYETLKSRGLELVNNDSLRFDIISLYEYDYNSLRKLEEEYSEMQFQQNYFKEFNGLVSSHFNFAADGQIESIRLPMNLKDEQKNTLLSYLWKIEVNRNFVLYYYGMVEKKILDLREKIEREISH